MPDVPNVPGVPALSSYGADAIELLVEDVVSAIFGVASAQWGIFLDGEAVVAADSTISFEYRQDCPVSDYPVEDGGFQSYDKVQLPADIRMRFATGGSIANRQNFLASIDEQMNTTDLYDVVTPEEVYLSYNFSHRDIEKRTAGNAGLVAVDIWLTEIRVTSTATFTNTQQPSEAGTQNSGNVQPQDPTSNVQENFSNGGWEVQ